jgi:hypothetical protein
VTFARLETTSPVAQAHQDRRNRLTGPPGPTSDDDLPDARLPVVRLAAIAAQVRRVAPDWAAARVIVPGDDRAGHRLFPKPRPTRVFPKIGHNRAMSLHGLGD